jgi:ABC-type transport system involved in multi-copper enzyme maturation permease subunit
MKTIIYFIFLNAIRDRLFSAIIALLLLVTGISMALAETVMVERPETSIALSAGMARIIVNIGIALFVCFQVRGFYDSKEIEVMLTRPISRLRLCLGLLLGFSLVATILNLILASILFCFELGRTQSSLIWIFSLIMEGWIVVAISLFASVCNKGFVTSVLTCFSFYVLGRLMAFLVATAHARVNFESVIVHRIMRYTIDTISVVIPRLDLFADTDWLVYGIKNYENIIFFSAQTAIFIPFMLCITLIDFKRKQF